MGIFANIKNFLTNRAGKQLAQRLDKIKAEGRNLGEQARVGRAIKAVQAKEQEAKDRTAAQKQLEKDPLYQFVHMGATLANGKQFNSSNVQTIRYDVKAEKLIISYHDGSVYEYYSIFPQEAKSIYTSRSKGTWVWDNLRIRGTVYGHRKPYVQITSPFQKGSGSERRQRWYEDADNIKEAKEALSVYKRVKDEQSGGELRTGKPAPKERSTPYSNLGRHLRARH